MGEPRATAAGVLVALLSVLAGPVEAVGQEPASTDRGVRSAIHTAWRDHIEAVQRSDLAGVMAMYEDDALYHVPGAVTAHGRVEIERMESTAMASAEVLEARHATETIRVAGETAWEVGTVVGRVRPSGQPVRRVGYRYMARWRRGDDGAWRVVAMVGEYLEDDQAGATPDGVGR